MCPDFRSTSWFFVDETLQIETIYQWRFFDYKTEFVLNFALFTFVVNFKICPPFPWFRNADTLKLDAPGQTIWRARNLKGVDLCSRLRLHASAVNVFPLFVALWVRVRNAGKSSRNRRCKNRLIQSSKKIMDSEKAAFHCPEGSQATQIYCFLAGGRPWIETGKGISLTETVCALLLR